MYNKLHKLNFKLCSLHKIFFIICYFHNKAFNERKLAILFCSSAVSRPVLDPFVSTFLHVC